MKIQPVAFVLTVVNLLLMLFILLFFRSQSGVTAAQSIAPDLRARSIELVDESGEIRAQFNVESSGEVVLRLRDANGDIRVKLGASETGSGLLLANDAAEPGVHLLATSTGTTLTLTTKDGKQRVIAP
jgi:hypothetical protein